MPRPRPPKPPPAGGAVEPRPGTAVEPRFPEPAEHPLDDGSGPPSPAPAGPFRSPDQPSGGLRVLTAQSDEDLAERARRGDDGAFGEIVARYQRVIFNLALRMSGSRDDARDLTQDVFVKVWRGLGGFDSRRRFFSWIYRIAIHECLNHRRRSGRVTELTGEPETTEVGPEGRAVAQEAEEGVRAALARLPGGDRELLVLRHFLDLSLEEIAEILRIPAKRVKSRL